MLLVLYYSWIMQAHYRISVFLAKIVFLPLQMIFKMSICKTFSLLLPSHNCIIIHNVQFSRCIWVPYSQETQWNIFCKVFQSISLKWWAKMDSNHRPHDYQSCALASWAIGPFWVVEISGIEPLTSCLQGRRSPSWAKPPYVLHRLQSTLFPVPSKLNNEKFLTHCTDL